MIFNNAIADLYNSKYHELQLKYDEIILKINHAESDSFILADKALEKAMTRGPRQSDASYEKALILANARYSRTNLKITAVDGFYFSSTIQINVSGDYVATYFLKKTGTGFSEGKDTNGVWGRARPVRKF